MKKLGLVALLLLSAAPVMAAENPPSIPFDADTNFLKMPDDLFVASEATKQSLFSAIQRAQGR